MQKPVTENRSTITSLGCIKIGLYLQRVVKNEVVAVVDY